MLFVDEIHRLNRQVEEVLYPAMEDYAIDIMIGKGTAARSIRLDLPKFTLVGATTRAGLLTAPLRDRFGVVHHLEFYTEEELKTIILHSAKVLGVEIDEEGAWEMSKRSRGTPRLANRLLKRVRTLPRYGMTGRSPKRLRILLWTFWKWTDMDWIRPTGFYSPQSFSVSPGDRWGWIPLPQRSVRIPVPLKMSMNLILLRMDFFCALPEAGWQVSWHTTIWG